jgi:hypothetical protein
MNARDQEVKYGYTLRDLDQMTHAAMIADRSMAMDYADRRDIAWSAIAEALCEAPHWPRRSSLIQAGWQAIYRAVREEYRQHGYADRAASSGHASAPRFAQFWYSPVAAGHEERIVERIAVGEIVATLTPTYRDALTALAVHGDYQRGADALGISYKAFVARIGVARQQTRGQWFEGETPRKIRTTDRRVGAYGQELATHCSNGHEWTPENTYTRRRILRGKRHTSRVCKTCTHDRSVERARARRESAA